MVKGRSRSAHARFMRNVRNVTAQDTFRFVFASASAMSMLVFYINRAGIQLSGRQRTELLKAKRLLQQRLAERQQAHALRKPGRPRQGP